jgi:restriction system protein
MIFVRYVKGSRHRRNIKKADRYRLTLKSIEHPAQQFSYIRQLDPFFFEEMILSSLAELGHGIRRNKRYTGDGGINGQAVINGQKTLIQAKRYKCHIQASHITDFAAICRRRRTSGLFVHSGKTGKLLRQVAQQMGLDIVSGERLLKLLRGHSFEVKV